MLGFFNADVLRLLTEDDLGLFDVDMPGLFAGDMLGLLVEKLVIHFKIKWLDTGSIHVLTIQSGPLFSIVGMR